MMIPLKTAKEIELMGQAGKKLALVMERILGNVKPSQKLEEIDRLAEELIVKQGGKPSFKMVPGYHWATCLNVNQGVVHGVPNDYQLKTGDLLSVDIGFFYRGWHADMARTIEIKNKKSDLKNKEFLKTGEQALAKAIKAARVGNRVGHLSQAIEREIKGAGFSPIQTLVGHGVGKELHEKPAIPCFLKGKIEATEELKPRMTLAIEVIYAQGKPGVVVKNDGWTIETVDGQWAALFEDTVAVTKREPLVLTRAQSSLRKRGKFAKINSK